MYAFWLEVNLGILLLLVNEAYKIIANHYMTSISNKENNILAYFELKPKCELDLNFNAALMLDILRAQIPLFDISTKCVVDFIFEFLQPQ